MNDLRRVKLVERTKKLEHEPLFLNHRHGEREPPESFSQIETYVLSEQVRRTVLAIIVLFVTVDSVNLHHVRVLLFYVKLCVDVFYLLVEIIILSFVHELRQMFDNKRPVQSFLDQVSVLP